MSWPRGTRVEYLAKYDTRGQHSTFDRVTGVVEHDELMSIPTSTRGTVVARHSNDGSIVRWDHEPMRLACVGHEHMKIIGDLPSSLEPEEVEKWLRA